MQKITCTTPTLSLTLPPCAAAPTAAHLLRDGFDPVAVYATVQDRIVTVTSVPADLARGVWRLSITADCGCFEAPVFVDICAPPAFTSEHTGTSGQGPVEVCCPDEPDPCAD